MPKPSPWEQPAVQTREYARSRPATRQEIWDVATYSVGLASGAEEFIRHQLPNVQLTLLEIRHVLAYAIAIARLDHYTLVPTSALAEATQYVVNGGLDPSLAAFEKAEEWDAAHRVGDILRELDRNPPSVLLA